MTYNEYFRMVNIRFPQANLIELRGVSRGSFTPIDAINIAAKLLFVERDVASELADETIKQLKHISEHGMHCFEM